MSAARERRGEASLLLTALLAGAIMLIDGYDLQVMSVVLPPLAAAWGKAPADFSLVLSAPVLGLGLGSALIAPLGDRYGRRPFVLAFFALLTLSVAGTAMAGGIWQLCFWRLLTGLGLGAALPNVSALVAELAPARNRAGLLTLIGIGIALGAMGSGLLVPPIVARFGWPGAFWFSFVVSVAIWLALLAWLPESPAYCAGEAPRGGWGSFGTIVSPAYRGRTALLWTLFAFNAFLLYMLASWVPTLLTARGWTLAAAGGAIAWMQTGGLVGGLAIAALMDRWRPGWALACGYVIAGTNLALFSLVPADALGWGILVALVGAGISGVHLTLNAVAAAIYPAGILSAGIGFTVAVARIGAIAGPLAGGLLVREGISAELFMALLLAPLAVCLLVALALPIGRARAKAPPHS